MPAPAPAPRTPRPPLPLQGADLAAYAEAAARLVLSARLGQVYPDPYAVAAAFRALSPFVRGAVYGGIALDPGSGLPALRDLVAVHADRANAPSFLAGQEAREREGRAGTPRTRAKAGYYRRLLGLDLSPPTRLETRLKRVFPERGVAEFEAVYDRFDPAEAAFVRYTMVLEQEDRAFGDPLLARRGDYAVQTAAFRETVGRYAQDESEIAFLLFRRVAGIRVEEIVRGRVGPLWSPFAPGPGEWPAGAYVLHAPLDRASVDLANDRDADPFSEGYRGALSPSSRSLVEEAAATLGYRVHRERKFACTPRAEAPLRALLGEAAGRCIVHVAPLDPANADH